MKLATVLFCTNLETDLAEIKSAAAAIAGTGQYLAVLVHALLPTVPINAHGVLPYGGIGETDHWTRALSEVKQSLTDKVAQIKAILTDEDCQGDVRPLLCAALDIEGYVAQSAQFADIATVASNLSDSSSTMRQMIHGILFQSPIGLLTNTQDIATAKKVLVAWDDSPAATQAVHAAVPLLTSADEVVIGCLDPVPLPDGRPYEPGAALAVWLGQHGCRVEIVQRPSGGKEIATCLIDMAREVGADLIVAGAYGHSRMRQAIFGGTTRTLLEQNDQAVFLAH